jgi:hypothetical protein
VQQVCLSMTSSDLVDTMEMRKAICHDSVLLVSIMLALSGCQTSLGVPITSTAPTFNLTPTNAVVLTAAYGSTMWQENWLKGNPCRPPCWEQITPGKTSASEAVKILERIPYIMSDSITTSVSSLVPEIGDISWEWSDSQEPAGISFDSNIAQQTVRRIGLIFKQPFLLKDVIETYGQPTHVAASAGYNEAGGITTAVQIIFASQGFWVNTTAPRDIRPDLWLNYVQLFSPGIGNFAQFFPDYKSNPDLIVPWQGYQSFEFYCRDEYKGNACREAK